MEKLKKRSIFKQIHSVVDVAFVDVTELCEKSKMPSCVDTAGVTSCTFCQSIAKVDRWDIPSKYYFSGEIHATCGCTVPSYSEDMN